MEYLSPDCAATDTLVTAIATISTCLNVIVDLGERSVRLEPDLGSAFAFRLRRDRRSLPGVRPIMAIQCRP
jgi:hypothetical protein